MPASLAYTALEVSDGRLGNIIYCTAIDQLITVTYTVLLLMMGNKESQSTHCLRRMEVRDINQLAVEL